MASKYLQKFPIPEGFPEVLHDLSREILREQPRDIVAFCAKYFRCKADGVAFDWEDDNPRAPKPVDYPRVKNAMRSPESSSSDKERPVKMRASRPSPGSTITANESLKQEVRRANEEAAMRTDSAQAPESDQGLGDDSVHGPSKPGSSVGRPHSESKQEQQRPTHSSQGPVPGHAAEKQPSPSHQEHVPVHASVKPPSPSHQHPAPGHEAARPTHSPKELSSDHEAANASANDPNSSMERTARSYVGDLVDRVNTRVSPEPV